ncbi:MAG: SGNH/GDSL hydrolase family protein [Clostridiaceae bacterium]
MSRKLKTRSGIFLCLVLLASLIFVVVFGRIQNNKKLQELIRMSQEESDLGKSTSQNQDENAITNPYKKIKNKKDTSILIIGDYNAQSEGVEEKSKWSSLVVESIESSYGIKPSVELLTDKHQGIVKTVENYNKNLAKKKYDFAILCVGADDVGVLKVEEFRQNYESFVRRIKEGNENCEVILIIEGSIKTDTTYPDAIKSIGDYYELLYIDIRDVFNKSNIAYDKLTTGDTITPNADGYKLYGDAIYNLIKINVAQGREVTALKKESLYAK